MKKQASKPKRAMKDLQPRGGKATAVRGGGVGTFSVKTAPSQSVGTDVSIGTTR